MIVSELLLQRTRAETVAVFFPDFFDRFRCWVDLANARESELKQFLEPLGLSSKRAATLSKLAKMMLKTDGRFPSAREEIESLPGIGQYVANAVLLFCHGCREPLLDVNMARVAERCFSPRRLADIRYDPWLQALCREVVNHRRACEINWAILDLAALFCKREIPRCEECPVQNCCRHAKRRRSRQ
ncbi:hypothetical protein KQI84_08630 [bacterium]|nr:hypothetical protein [bacterium]